MYNHTSICNTDKRSSFTKWIQDCFSTVWYECIMAHKRDIKALICLLMNGNNANECMYEIIIIFYDSFYAFTFS